jgi:transposase
LSVFQRGRIVRARLAGASATKTATSLSVSRAVVLNLMTAYTNHGKSSTVERNSGRKPKPSERDRRALKRIVYENYGTAAANVTEELNILRKDPVSTKNSPTRTSQIQHQW